MSFGHFQLLHVSENLEHIVQWEVDGSCVQTDVGIETKSNVDVYVSIMLSIKLTFPLHPACACQDLRLFYAETHSFYYSLRSTAAIVPSLMDEEWVQDTKVTLQR